MQRKIVCFSYRKATKEEIASIPTQSIAVDGNTIRQLHVKGIPYPMIHEAWFDGDDPVTLQDCMDSNLFISKALTAIFMAMQASKGTKE